MITVEFRGDLWIQKTRAPDLSCGVVCVVLRLAVLVDLRLVTERQTDRHRAMASTADAHHRAVTILLGRIAASPHRMDAVFWYKRHTFVVSVCVGHIDELCRNGLTNRDAV